MYPLPMTPPLRRSSLWPPQDPLPRGFAMHPPTNATILSTSFAMPAMLAATAAVHAHGCRQEERKVRKLQGIPTRRSVRESLRTPGRGDATSGMDRHTTREEGGLSGTSGRRPTETVYATASPRSNTQGRPPTRSSPRHTPLGKFERAASRRSADYTQEAANAHRQDRPRGEVVPFSACT